MDPEDEAALLRGSPPLIGQKRKAELGAAAVFGSPLRIPRRARSSRPARDDDSDGSTASGSHAAAAAATRFSGRTVRAGSKRRSAAPPEDQAVAELLLGMGDLITARTDSPPSSSDGSGNRGGGSNGAAAKRQGRPARQRRAAKAPDRWEDADADAPPRRRRQQRVEPAPPAPPGKRRAAVAAVSAIAAAAASDKARSDDEGELGISALEAAMPAQPLPRSASATAPLPPPTMPNGTAGSKEQRSRLAGPVAPADAFDETLLHVHQVRGAACMRFDTPPCCIVVAPRAVCSQLQCKAAFQDAITIANFTLSCTHTCIHTCIHTTTIQGLLY